MTPAVPVAKAASNDNDDNYDNFFSDDADDGDDDFVFKTDYIIIRLKTNGNRQTKSLTHDVILLQLLHSRTLLLSSRRQQSSEPRLLRLQPY